MNACPFRLALVCTALLFAFPVAAQEKPAVTPTKIFKARAIDPEDLGISKYQFDTVVPEGKLLVVRRTVVHNRRKLVTETIQNTDGGLAEYSVTILDSWSFPFADIEKPVVLVRERRGTERYSDVRVGSHGFINNRLSITLVKDIREDDKDDLKKDAGGGLKAIKNEVKGVIAYESFLEDYSAAKKRVPKLPAIGEGEWSYANILQYEIVTD